MQKNIVVPKTLPIFILGMVALLLLLQPATTEAGIFDASQDVTYKEYWVPHSTYTGGVEKDSNGQYDANCAPTHPYGNSWYLEPYPSKCRKTVEVTLPDDFTNAAKVEMYLDLWRNETRQNARFSINGGEPYAPNVGWDWSRSPWVGEIRKSDLRIGKNTIEFWTAGGGYHVHDIAIRVYYDAANPLQPGSGSDVTPPNGSLLTVKGDGAAVPAGSGGVLNVNNNQITLTANVSGAKYVEFHGSYYGYDEDNDGDFTDWHNRGRNNWYPGGTDAKANGGTVDHIGTAVPDGSGNASVTWDISHIPDQSGVRFKIRVVDQNGNVREAAGGQSASFTLQRSEPVIAFIVPEFEDAVLWLEGSKPKTVNREIILPPDLSDFNSNTAILVHSFWRFTRTSFNNNPYLYPDFPGNDHWQLSKRSFNFNYLQPGRNVITYSYSSDQNAGEFAEKPGPMIILQRKSGLVGDNQAPVTYSHFPKKGERKAKPGTDIIVQLFDPRSGVNRSTIVMKVDGQPVTPQITGTQYNYLLRYSPPGGYAAGQVVNVEVDACDQNGNCMSTDSYSFTIETPAVPSIIESDDFNSCALNTSVWTFQNPTSDASYTVTGDGVELAVPAGVTHDLWEAPSNTAPRLMQAANDVDFEIEAKFEDTQFTAANQLQGLIIQQDSENFIRYSLQYNGTETLLQLFTFQGGVASQRYQATFDGTSADYLRVRRQGDEWRFFAYDDAGEWFKYAQFSYPLEVTQVGAFVGNVGSNANNAPAFSSTLDYFFNTADPIDPEDADALVLPVQVVGEGEVTKNPQCGNPVTLTAVSELGWSFAGWSSTSGAISGTTNPLTTPFDRGETVTATFTRNEYMLDVNVVNNGDGPGGSVTLSPDQDVYYYNDEVTLTVNTPDGWRFDGWTGALSGSNTTETITMSQNEAVTATFTQQVDVNVNVVSNGDGDGGTVQKSSDKSVFDYGELLTLTASPAAGWEFVRWNGLPAQYENIAENAQITLSLTEDLTLNAVFAKRVTLSVNVSGQGSVLIDGNATPQPYYLWGDTVQLTAVPANGWYFDKWEGSVTGNNASRQIRLQGDSTVTAVFTDRPPTINLYLPTVLYGN